MASINELNEENQINNINELQQEETVTSDIKFRRNEFWKNLRKFLINCKCTTNDKLRHNLLREIGVNLGTTTTTTNTINDELINNFDIIDDTIINDDDIPTQENAFKNSQCQYIYKSLDKTGKYECLFDDDIYGHILWPTTLEKSINFHNQQNNDSSSNNGFSSSNSDCAGIINNMADINQNDKKIKLNSIYNYNNNNENYINIQPIIDDLLKNQLLNNDLNNEIIKFKIELNTNINLYIRKNIYKYVSFVDIYDYLFYSNDGVLRQQYFKNGLNIDYNDYTDIIPYLLNIKSRLDHIKLLLHLQPNGSYHLTWILLAFELSDKEYHLNLPPKLKIDSEFQRQCFIEAVLQLARKKSLSIIENDAKCKRAEDGASTSTTTTGINGRANKFNLYRSCKLKKAIFYLIFNIILYVNRKHLPVNLL